MTLLFSFVSVRRVGYVSWLCRAVLADFTAITRIYRIEKQNSIEIEIFESRIFV